MSEKLILIDGNSIINRAFFGVPDLTNAEGLHTNAIYGFINILLRILQEENGDYLCVAFDVHEPTFRHKMYEAYKGTRKGMPDELRQQVKPLKNLLAAMGILIIEKGGYEADDILGTLAKRAEADGKLVTLVSGDRDLLQIATDNILIRIPKTKGGKTEIENYHTKDVIDKYGLEPLQIIELKGLMGDSSDNIPGVPKIGEKTATELLKQYGTIDNLKEHIPEITKNSVRQTLTDNFHLAELSRTLATIEINAPIDFSYEDARIGNIFTPEAYILVKEFGFKNILSKFDDNSKQVNDDYANNFRIIDDFAEAEGIINSMNEHDCVAFYITNEIRGIGLDKTAEVYGISICFSDEEVFYIPAAGMLTAEYLCSRFEETVLNTVKTQYVTFNLKEQLLFTDKLSTPDFIKKHIIDLEVAAYLCNPLKNDYMIEDVANEYASIVVKGKDELFGKSGFDGAVMAEADKIANYSCCFTYICRHIYSDIMEKIKSFGMHDLFYDIEMPLVGCLYRMEREGIRILPDELREYSIKLGEDIKVLEQEIFAEAGEEFNINSPIQLGEILFGKMGMPGGKKTKKGYSTAADVLEKLAVDYPFVSRILDYRAVAKLKSTYTDGLIAYMSNDGRIHSTFNQTITATGRISSTEPNLQNIPVKMEQGRLIRKVFVPREGCVFVDADYSQIELRIMAHLSGDEQMCAAFNSGADVHSITASKVFNVPIEEVTPLQRRNAKAVNFGIIYGISAFGLAKDINVSNKEAKEFIEQYFVTFPKVKSFLDDAVKKAKDDGYVTTAYGRRRPLPEISSSNFMQRSFGERVAMNAPIQGTAADIMKIAMIKVEGRLRRENLKSRIILQVHDELMIEAYIDEADKVSGILKEEMENAASLAVPMPVETSTGKTWYEAK